MWFFSIKKNPLETNPTAAHRLFSYNRHYSKEDSLYKPALSLLRFKFNGNEQQLQLHVAQPVNQTQIIREDKYKSRWRLFSNISESPQTLVCLTSITIPNNWEVEWNLLADSGEGEAYKGTRQVLCVHLISHSFKVILLPCVLLNLTKNKKKKSIDLINMQIKTARRK